MKRIITSESVCPGHPDKVCDQISDALLDSYLAQDSESRVAVETMATKGKIIVAGEVTSKGVVDIEKEIAKTLLDIGYNPDKYEIESYIHKQSPDIAQGVDIGGAGDQGMMFGYATNETPDYLPPTLHFSKQLLNLLEDYKLTSNNPIANMLKPDGKSQVTIEKDTITGKYKIKTVILSVHHDEKVNYAELKEVLLHNVISPILPEDTSDIKILINPTGKFVCGGLDADTGLTGRKIIVDTYGGIGRHGGGAFSGKDPSKVDRSGAYMARYVAKSLVSNQLAAKCEIQIAYAIGVAEPVGVYVNSFGSGDDDKLIKIVKNNFDLRPQAIIEKLDLKRPIYYEIAKKGHFGSVDLPWEQPIRLEKYE